MSRDAVRVGTAATPDITTTGAPGTSDQVRTFQETGRPRYARPCVVTNLEAVGGDILYVLPNDVDCSAANFMVKLTPGQAVDISVESQIAISSVSLYFASAAYTQAQVRGWYA